jgi:hypothetical protein
VQYHQVRLNFQFEAVNKMFVWSGSAAPDTKAFSMQDASILVDYVYLDSEERRRFAQVGHEYLIEQVQFTGEESIADATNTTQINGKFKLNFNHPCKELIWALRVGAYNGESTKNLSGTKGRFLTYTHDDALWKSSALDYAAENLARGMVDLEAPTASGVVSEAIALVIGQNSVTHNSTALDGLTVTVNYDGAALSSSSLDVWLITNPLVNGSYNLGQFLSQFDVTLTLNSTGDAVSGYTVDVISHSLSLTDVSVPIEDWTDNRSTTSSGGLNPYDCTVVQLNYGVRLDGKGNPMLEGNIQLNGHDRFDIQEGAYFNYVQPYHHHTRTPADGINLYSFGLHPEQHQPNGTANLSRIDNTLLVVRFADPFRANVSVPKLNLSRDSKFYIYAFSYNVLRINKVLIDAKSSISEAKFKQLCNTSALREHPNNTLVLKSYLWEITNNSNNLKYSGKSASLFFIIKQGSETKCLWEIFNLTQTLIF